MNEVFKWIKGHEGSYKISDHGNVMSYVRRNKKLIKPCDNGTGYLQVQLRYGERGNRKREVTLVHKLVAEAFLNYPRSNKYLEVDHIDRNRRNNHVDNLRVINRSDNQFNSIRVINAKRIYETNNNKYYTVLNIRNRCYHSGVFNYKLSARIAYEYLESIKGFIDCITAKDKNEQTKYYVLNKIQSIYNSCPVSKVSPISLKKCDI